MIWGSHFRKPPSSWRIQPAQALTSPEDFWLFQGLIKRQRPSRRAYLNPHNSRKSNSQWTDVGGLYLFSEIPNKTGREVGDMAGSLFLLGGLNDHGFSQPIDKRP